MFVKRGAPFKAIVLSKQSISISIYGAISVNGIIFILPRKSTLSVTNRNRRIGGEDVKINDPVGVRPEHIFTT